MIHGQPAVLSGILRLSAPSVALSPPLRAGETLAVRVLRAAGVDRWTVQVRGKALIAQSSVPLAPGARLWARVSLEGSTILLRLEQPMRSLAHALSAARLPSDVIAQAAARALLESGLGVSADRLERLRAVARGPGEGRARRLRLAAELLRKLPTLDARDLDLLCVLVGQEEERGEEEARQRRERRKGQRHPAVPVGSEIVRKALWRQTTADAAAGEPPADRVEPAGDRAGDLLKLFNHLKAADEEWVLLPCRLVTGAGVEVSGSVRVLYDTATRAVRALVVGAAAEGGPAWWFRIIAGPAGMECRAFCEARADRRPAAGELEGLRATLGNLGVRLADTVEGGALFDGFALVGPDEPRPVDLLG